MLKKIIKNKYVKLKKYRPVFTTISGEEHIGLEYKYAIDKFLCSIPEYLMIDIKHDGYIYDENLDMYMVNNIIKISWELLDTKIVLDDFNWEYKRFYTDEEVSKMKIYDGE